MLHPNQYGFRKFRSTTDVLVRLDTFIKMAFARKVHVVTVFFDIEKASWNHHILRTLMDVRMTGPLPQFIWNFLHDRSMRVRIGAIASELYPQLEGVPQGSVSSCTLFALAINGLATCMPKYVESSLYVDDFAVFTRSASLPSAVRRSQQSAVLVCQT